MQEPKILIIDHPDRPTTSAVYKLFQSSDTHHTVLKCSSVIDALCLLNIEEDIRLVFFEIDLPNLEGLNLLTRIPDEYPGVKLMVHGSINRTIPESNITIIDRNQEPEDTAQTILSSVEAASESVPFPRLSLLELLCLIEQEKQSMLLDITSNENRSRCCFDKGVLMDAVFDEKRGEESLLDIIALVNPVITIRGIPKQKVKRRIHKTLFEIIQSAIPADVNSGNQSLKEQLNGESYSKDSDKDTMSMSNHLEELMEENIPPISPTKQKNNTKEGGSMGLEDHLAKLKKVNGFKAAAVMNFTGEILVSDSIDPNIQLEMVGATFNDIFRTAHEASEKIGLEACQETTIKTPNGIIIMRCSGVKAKVHFHMIMIMAADGNQALAKMEMEKLIPTIMAELE